MTDETKKHPIQEFIDESKPLEEPFYSTLSNNLLDLVMTDETKKPERYTEGEIDMYVESLSSYNETYTLYKESGEVIKQLRADLKAAQESNAALLYAMLTANEVVK